LIYSEIDSSYFPITMKLRGDTSHATRYIKRRLSFFKKSVINHLRPAALISFTLHSYDSPVRASDSLALMRQLFTLPFYLPQSFISPFFDFLSFDCSFTSGSFSNSQIFFSSPIASFHEMRNGRANASGGVSRAEANNFNKFRQK